MAALRQQLVVGAEGQPLDGVLITDGANRRYLSGFTGSAGILLITPSAALLLTDARYVEQAGAEAREFEVVKYEGSPWPAVAAQAKRLGAHRLGFESEEMSVDRHRRLLEALAQGEVEAELVPLRGFVEQLRQVKDAEEIELIRQAVEIGDRAFEEVAASLRPGMTEREVAWQLEVAMRQRGADGLSFPIIVAAGPNGAMPHHSPSDRPIRPGEPVVIDMGCRYRGYCSDMTRTIVLGEADEQFWRVYQTVLQAQQACEAGTHAGLLGKQADALARDVIVAAGYKEHFGHGTGHGVGLDVHEAPYLTFTERGEAMLPERCVVTVEPGIYLSGWGGVRIEDMIVVGPARSQILTTAHKHPIIDLTA